jgi:succinate dehydrogenase/fumarate reductase flavoprotein subunit
VPDGSSVIDLLVYEEQAVHGRQVYLDYRKNPFGLERIDLTRLSPEAAGYLEAAGGDQPTPIDRLIHMNRPAYDLYHSKGVDLRMQKLPIALCAQHHNGGISVDLWWQTTLPGLFAVGECAGTHGISRPGGSALNAGQVGALRAAQYICQSKRKTCENKLFEGVLQAALENHGKLAEVVLKNNDNAEVALQKTRRRMSDAGGAVRNIEQVERALKEVCRELSDFEMNVGICSREQLVQIYHYRDSLVCQKAILSAMADQLKNEISPDTVQQGRFENGQMCLYRRPVRPLPQASDVFETVWRGYRDNQNVY